MIVCKGKTCVINGTLAVLRTGLSLGISFLLAGIFSPVLLYAESQSPPETGIKLMDAVKATLEKQPDIRFQEQEVEISRGLLQQARGQFDPALKISGGHGHEYTPLSSSNDFSKQETDTISTQLSLSKKFRNGVIVSPGIQLSRADDPVEYSHVQNNSKIDLTVTVPLLKGWGETATAAKVMAAEKEYEYRLHQLRHNISNSIFNTVSAYWKYLAATRKLDQRRSSESRAERYVKETRILIEADECPAEELEKMMANLEAKKASLIAGEQGLYEARQGLGLAMGLQLHEIDTLPLSADDFPHEKDHQSTPFVSTANSIVNKALTRRDDYQALKELQESRRILVKEAINKQKPRLDLELNAGYSGLDEGDNASDFFHSTRRNIPGLSTSALLTYEWPFGNNSAKGILLQRKAAYEQSVISTDNLTRHIASRVSVAISALENSTKELNKDQKSVRYYRKALDNERKKVKLGMSTLLDLIVVEDRLTNALLNEISAQLKHAVSLVQLRFETGTILTANKDRVSIDMDKLATIPSFRDSEK